MFVTFPSPRILSTPYYFSVAWDGFFDIHQVHGITLPEKLSMATPKRRTEFLAGRYCAAKAIQAFDPLWTGQVGMNPDGAPSWPEGLVGSITHTQGLASAAVAPSNACFSVGIDSEKMANAHILQTAGEIVLTEEERRLSLRLPIPEDQFILLVFCAKESIYKCLYPLMKRSLELSRVILDGIHFQNRTFDFHLSGSIVPDVLRSCGAQGRFEFSRGCIHAAVELKKNPLRTFW